MVARGVLGDAAGVNSLMAASLTASWGGSWLERTNVHQRPSDGFA